MTQRVRRNFFLLTGILSVFYICCLFDRLTCAFDFDVNLVLAPIVCLLSAFYAVSRTYMELPEILNPASGATSTGISILFARLFAEGLGSLICILVLVGITRLFLPSCEPLWGLAYFLMGPVFSLAFGLAVGLFCAVAIQSRKKAYLFAAAIVIGNALWPLIRYLFVPVAFAYGYTFGYFPGPIYDPVVGIESPYFWSRLLTTLLIGILLAFSSLIIHRKKMAENTTASPITSVLTLIFGLPAIIILIFFGDRIGISSGKKAIFRQLDGVYKTDHFVLHFPSEGDIADHILLAAADHEADYQRLVRDLKTEPKLPIHSFIYPSIAMKKRLLGAGETTIAFISSSEMHLNDEGFPHPVLLHELVHVMTGPRGLPILGFSELVGLTEGIAVAQEKFQGELTIHQWAAAMKRLGWLPKVDKSLSFISFWKLPGNRAYVACGSFVQWLIENKGGVESFWKVYSMGDFKEAYGCGLKELTKEWNAFLDAVPIQEGEIDMARYRFSKKGLFETPCARAQERLTYSAEKLLRDERPRQAAATYERAARLQHNDPRLLERAMSAWYTAQEFQKAEELAEAIIQKSESEGPAMVFRAKAKLADIAFQLGEGQKAYEIWSELAFQNVAPSEARRGACLLSAAKDMQHLSSVAFYLTAGHKAREQVYLNEAVRSAPDDPVVLYLLARRQMAADLPSNAAESFSVSLSSGLDHPLLRIEAARQRAVCWLRAGNPDKARNALGYLVSMPEAKSDDRFFAQLLKEKIEAYESLLPKQKK